MGHRNDVGYSPTVTGYKIQQSHHQTYQAGHASCRDQARHKEHSHCNSGDWHVSDTAGCGGNRRPVCSKVEPKVCPVIDGTKADVSFINPPKVSCTYHQSAFKSAHGLNAWVEAFGEDEEYQTKIMPSFCAQPSVFCPEHKKTGKKMKSCSRFNDNDAAGKKCRNWAKKFPVESKRIKQVFCKTYKTPDCKMSDSYSSDSSYSKHSHKDKDHHRRYKKKDDCDKDSTSFGGAGIFIFFFFLLIIIIAVAAACAGGRRGKK